MAEARAFALCALLVACGGSPPLAHESAPATTGPALPEVGQSYEVRHRVRASFDGTELGVLRARLLMTVTDRHGPETTLTIVAELLADDWSVAARDELVAVLRSDGALRGPVRSRCVDPNFDELASTRLVEAILARAQRGAATELTTELDEATAPAEFHEDGEELAATARLTLRAAPLFDAVYRGEVSVTVHHRFADDDLLVGQSRMSLEGEVARGLGSRRGRLAVVSETDVRRIEGALHTSGCGTGFDGSQVVAMIAARRGDLDACYDTGRALDPALAGRVVYRFVVTSAGAVATTTPQPPLPEGAAWEPVHGCVAEVLGSFLFHAGPPEDTTFEQPINFALPEE